MFKYYYDLFMANKVALASLEKLVKARKLTQDEVDSMVADRLEQQGF